ncbi:MAG: aromatic ring-hydroxylating dioxygenase subunit alpha [Aeromicrobium sp.]
MSDRTVSATAVADVTASMDLGWQLPAELYSDPQHYEREREAIFHRAWQFVCREEELGKPGDYVTTVLGDVPVVVVRDKDGSLQAHVNVCLHRLHPVAEGSGCKKILQCRYHGWTYGLDGSLKSAPRSQDEPGFDKSAMVLQSVAVDTLGGLVFANPDPNPTPLAEFAAPAEDLMVRHGIDLGGWDLTGTFTYEVAANWKLFAENALECYHCPLVHNGTFGTAFHTESETYICDNYVNVATQVAPVAQAFPGESRASDDLGGFRMLFLWPFTYVSVDDYTGTVARMQPTGPHTCRFVVDTFARPGTDPKVLEESLAMYDETFMEDKAVVTAQQIGYHSGRVPQGRLMTNSESSIAMFQRRTWQALTGEAG